MKMASTWSGRMRLAACVLAVSLSGCAWLSLATGEVSMSAPSLTERLAKRFPLERSVGGLLEATLSDPVVALDERDQRMTVDCKLSARLTLTNKKLDGSVKLSGRPHYDAASRALFLKEARVERLRFEDMSDALAEALRKAASSLARDALDNKPLHVFKPEDFKRQGVTLEPERLSVRGDQLVLQ
jgi:hypothetical protein